MSEDDNWRDATDDPYGSERWSRDLKDAAAFLTRLPVSSEEASFELRNAMRAFPIVGALLGLGAGVVLWLGVSLNLTTAVACLIAILAVIAATGALHEDGLADSADGLWGGSSREAKLAIMHDSRIGTFGVLALVASLLLRSGSLTGVTAGGLAAATAALVAAGALSRHSVVAFMAGTPPARTDGIAVAAGKPTSETARTSLAIALVIGIPALWIAGGLPGVVVGLGLAVLAYWAMKWLAVHHVGGHTGDLCGALQQASEIAILLGLCATAG